MDVITLNADAITIKTEFAISLTAILGQENLIKQVASELTAVICKFISSASADTLRDLAEHFMDSIKQNKISTGNFDVLGRVVLLLGSCKETVLLEGDEFTAIEYRSHLVNNICNTRWHPGIVLSLGQTLLELSLSDKEMSFVIKKIASSLSLVKLQEVPQIIHTLLVAASKGCHKSVVAGIISFFNDVAVPESDDDMSTDPDSDLSQAEGTSLLHLSFAVKHDQELGKAVVQQIKSSKQLTYFTFGLGLSLVQHDRFAEQVLTSLKSTVAKSVKTSVLWKSSLFLQSVLAEETDVKKLLAQVLKKSNEGWDHVTEGLIKLGFTLMDCSGPESDVGSYILEECFKLHLHCRKSVLTELLNRVVTATPLIDTHHTSLLIRISKRSVQLLLSHSSKLKDSLSNVPLIPLSNAQCVLQSLVPVMRYDSTIRDAAILVFRKSLFSKKPESRRIAVFGLSEMMKKFRVGDNYSQSSQLSCSQVQVHLMVTDDINEAVCTEILLLLRRGLSQQGSIRSDIYDRLPSVLFQNPKLYPMLLKLLDDQLTLLIEEDSGILPPLKLGNCLSVLPEQTLLREPLMNLLRATFKCTDIVRSREPEECEKLDDMLESVTLRATKCDLEDWDLDKAADFSASGVGSRNTVTALSLIATLEVLLENVLVRGNGTLQSGEQFKKIFKQMYSVHELLNEKQSGRGKKARGGTPYFSLSGVKCLLQYLIVNDMSTHEEFVGILKTVSNILTWTLGVLSDHLKKAIPEYDIDSSKEIAFTLGPIAKSLICHLKKDKNLYRDQTSNLLHKCIQTMTVHHIVWLEEFCETAASSMSDFWDQISQLFIKSVEVEDFTESQNLLAALNLLQSPCERHEELEKLLFNLLPSTNLTSMLARDVVSGLLSSRRLSSTKLDLHLTLSRDILAVLGDIEVEEDDSPEEEVHHKLVDDNSAVKMVSVLVASLETVLGDVEWGVQHGCKKDDDTDTLCQYLMEAGSLLGVLLSCRIPRNSSPIDHLSRTVKKFYNAFTLLIKQESGRAQDVSREHGVLKTLEQLAKLVGSSTNQRVYSYLIYLEQREEEGRKVGAAAIRKQAVSVPGIVYSVEQTERNLIILSKKIKTVDLMEHFKRSTARDFKIEMAVLEQKLNKPQEEGTADQPKIKRKKKE